MTRQTLSNHERIYLDRRGEGPAVVLTHGLGDSAETWAELLPHLDGYETWTWDLLGHGRSAKPGHDDAYTMEGALADLERVIEAVGREVVLVGHSLGGYLSQHRAVRDLSQLRALVLIATGPGYRDPVRREQWNDFVRERAVHFDMPADAARMAEQHDELVMARLERLTLPVLQILGERDSQYHGAFEVMKRRVGGIESCRVADAGHQVHRTHGETVGPVVRAFLERLT